MKRIVTLLLIALGCRGLAGQVDPNIKLSAQREAVTPVGNRSTVPQSFTLELYHGTVLPSKGTQLLSHAKARISPSHFVLAPGEQQLVRIHVEEATYHGEVLHLVTTVVPTDTTTVVPTDTTHVHTALHIRTRLITRVTAP